MGTKSNPAAETSRNGDGPGVWPWQFLPGRPDERNTDQFRKKLIAAAALNGLADGHVYTAQVLAELRQILGVTERDWPNSRLWKETDHMIAFLASGLATTPRKAVTHRRSSLKWRIIAPAKKLLSALRQEDIAKEFWQQTGALRPKQYGVTIKMLEVFVSNLERHSDILRQRRTPSAKAEGANKPTSRRGTERGPWDAGLKRSFSYAVAGLCSRINPDFEPTRISNDGKEIDSQFGKALQLLSPAVFKSWGKRQKISFAAAIRHISTKHEVTIVPKASGKHERKKVSAGQFTIRLKRRRRDD